MDHIQGLILEAEKEKQWLKKQNAEYEERIEDLTWSEQLYKNSNIKLMDELEKETEKVEKLTSEMKRKQQGNDLTTIINIVQKQLSNQVNQNLSNQSKTLPICKRKVLLMQK